MIYSNSDVISKLIR